jgi:hypothetical protein
VKRIRINNTTGYVSAYPTLASKIRQRINDVPWKLAELRDSIIPSDFARLHKKALPYTMVGYGRLHGLYRAIRYVVVNNIKGDVVECGAARGGSAALMGMTLKHLHADKMLWVFDTFAGLPAPTQNDPDYEIAKEYTGTCRGEFEEVQSLFADCQILDQSILVKGLFRDTLPVSSVDRIAVLHLDGDWYESVRDCLEHLYDRVSPGGIIQIDDYGHWAGARKATHEFLAKRSINVRLRYLDYTGRQFRKPRD